MEVSSMSARCPLLLTLLLHIPMMNCLSLHLSQGEDAGPGTELPLANLSLGAAAWLYRLDRSLTPGPLSRCLELGSRSGELRQTEPLDCSLLPANPLPVYLRYRAAGPAGLLTVRARLPVYVHGEDCYIKYRRKSPGAELSVSVLLGPGDDPSPCLAAGQLLLNVWDVVPAPLRPLSPLCTSLNSSRLLLLPPLRSGQLLASGDYCLGSGAGPAAELHCSRSPASSPQPEPESEPQPLLIRVRVVALRPHAHRTRPLVRRKRSTNRSPQFQLPSYQVSVPENEPADTRVIVLSAHDLDEGESGRLEYTMESLFDSRSSDYFHIDPDTGAVTTTQQLDRETKDTHVFKITAYDNGTPRRMAAATLTVTVSDTNDHAPLFELSEYREVIRENVEVGYEVLTIRATDSDAPSNANMLYRIVNNNGNNSVFEIDSKSGIVRTRGVIDREVVSEYHVIVEANDQGKDPGPLSATATVYITVEDENDNFPQFSEKRYIVQVPEDVSVNTKILQVKATDRDKGNNAVIHYSIVSGNIKGQFYIDSVNGNIDIINPLDYETTREYTLRIKAQDGGRPPLINGTGLVMIQVIDVNDNAPIFVSTPFQATVLENVAIGYSVIHIQAIDADSGNNARLEYRLVDTPPDFPLVIGNNTGWITVAKELDREITEFYTFSVEARDNGIPSMTSSAGISITVLDVNDNNPTFTERVYYLRLNEDAPVGSSVLTVTAIDKDVNSVVTYQISSGNTRNRFSITSQSGGGLITLALPLDYKQERQYVLTVTASDGTRLDTVQVYINVTDANTHRPVFQSSHYTLSINEDKPVGTTVVIISASDEDTGENARITYIMEDNFPQFKINPDTGTITTQMELDYEDQASYTLAITARDNGIPQKSDTTYVEILVNDANDNIPQFVRDLYQGTVYEDVPLSNSVLQISATDRDSGLNGRVFYTFHGGDDGDGDFYIEPSSGIIRTGRKLDRENVPVYNLRAFAVDKGNPPLKASVNVQITVLDVNDNAPAFEKDEFDIYIEENSPVGSSVARITATDPDEGTNAQIMYQIVEGNIPEVFQLDMFTGDLIALTDLDYETKTEYIIVVQATSAPLVNRATIHIRLVDKNDNAPVLRNFEIIFNNYVTNKSNSFPSGVIGKIPAYDPDVSDHLFYTFIEGNELNLLILDQNTGQLKLSQDLDNNRPLEANLKISVTGEHCEVSSRSGRCAPGVCKNGGTCINLLVGGFRCECPSGEYERPYCEMTTRSFPPQSFVTFKGLRQRFHFTVSLMFATQERNALLLYNGRFNEKHDFIALEIIEEQIQLTFSAGESTTTVAPFIPGGVSDGEWHSVQVQYYNKPNIGRLGIPHGPSGEKVAVVTVDDCDTAVSVRFGNRIGNYSCAAQGTQTGSKKSLDLTGPLLLGGVPNLPEDFPVRNREFVGCMRYLTIDSKQLDMASFIANNGTLAGCAAKKNFCDVNVCQNGGHCVNKWNTYSCECPVRFGGKNCEQVMPNSQRFKGTSQIRWDDLDITISVPWYIGLMFRTRKSNGFLVQANAGTYSKINIQIIDSNLEFEVHNKHGLKAKLRMTRTRVSDGNWHHLLVEIKSMKDGKDIKYLAVLSLDYGMYQDSVEIGNELPGLKLRNIYVGHLPEDGIPKQQGFHGCMQGLRMGDTSTNIATLNMDRAEKLHVESGCDVPDPCDSIPCPRRSYCLDEWDSYSCICEPGYFGKNCMDVCRLNPCEHISSCVHDPNSSQGYTCNCGENYYGQYCENKIDLPCPRGRWGNPMCGPCNCDTNKGFNPDCNKTTGECRCKDNHYQPPGSDTCYPCDCFPMGSQSRTCDVETGQCSCKSGVIGQHCNRCDNPFAEITSDGCEVKYNVCPKAFEAGIWWPRTKYGRPAAMPCPKGSVGTAIRHCNEEKGWLPPDLFNCTTLTFIQLKSIMEKLHRNETKMNTRNSKKIANMLQNATKHTPTYYGNDVKIAYELIKRILQYEGNQQDFELAATQDVEFNENIVKAASAILDPQNKDHWEQIQRTEGGTAHLMKHYEEYAHTIARNLRKTYLRPFTIVTPNMIIAVELFDMVNFPGASMPQYEKIHEKFPKDLESSVFFPDALLKIEGDAGLGDHPEHSANGKAEDTFSERNKRNADGSHPYAVAVVIIYRSLGLLLPERYDPDRRSMRVPNRPVINTPIVSATVYTNDHPLPQLLESPVTLKYRLFVTEERTKPVCVFWNHTLAIGGTGGWSSKGCELVLRNESHINCQCNHMTSFAVLMDISKREHGEVLPLKIVTYTTVAISLFALFVTFLFLMLVRTLRSNLHNIHKNLVAALFFSELVFLIGINQTDNPFVCSVIALLLHYFYLCTFAWTFVEGLHIYRMLTDLRNVNHGQMRFYYTIGWGIPAIITGLAMGLDPQGYGNPDFCWLSVHDTLIWSFAGPICVVVIINIVIFILAAKASCGPRHRSFEKTGIISGLRTAFLMLLLISATWLLGLMAVNNDTMTFHYLFAIFSCFQGLFIFFCHCIFNEEVRKGLKNIFTGKKQHADDTVLTRTTVLSRSLNCNNTYVDEGRMYRTAIGESTASMDSTVRSAKSHNSCLASKLREEAQRVSLLSSQAEGGQTEPDSSIFHKKTKKPNEPDSDSDSELSLEDDHSSSYASSHSSESEEEEFQRDSKWKQGAPKNNEKNPIHSTPKGEALPNHVKRYWPAECTTASDSEDHGTLEKLKVETKVNVELHRENKSNHCSDIARGGEDEEKQSTSIPHPSSNPQPEQRKGILKNKVMYPPPLKEKNRINQIHNELSNCKATALSSRTSSVGSSDGTRTGTSILIKQPSRQQSQDQLNGVTPIPMNIRTGTSTVHGDTSDSEGSNETSI
ncbi:cadherin EGF LAG seven-pass G-type receptor 1 isoform X4 [Hemiscyllium ocellatum]|uniref:cadherin EGF LAG seven-pass G-type receptor 1 isoform X4 n=1 Tax=Hemiscyllium ocellatum TaxID=170820 RepID=UPI00296611F5|nr:cadherin EGF LAG seven-pass G-type receptor 1 isoform X4 [Hemiscyllium ocellatum]